MNHREFMHCVYDRCRSHGSLRKYAKHLGVSPSFLSAVGTGRKPPSQKILRDMNLTMTKKVTRVYEYTFSKQELSDAD